MIKTLTLCLLAFAPTFAAELANSFGPINVVPGQTLRLCANNTYGDETIGVRFMFVDASTGRVVEFHDATLTAGQGTCFSAQATATSTRSLIGLLTPAPNARGGWDRPVTVGAVAGHLVEVATGKTAVFLPAVQRFNVILPAVQ